MLRCRRLLDNAVEFKTDNPKPLMPPSKRPALAKRPKNSIKSAAAKKQLKELKHDLRYASFHEAAHGIVAASGGFSGTVYLAPPTFHHEGDRLVQGQFRFPKMPSARFAATVAWAGVIAECILGGGTDLDEFEDELEVSPLSPSDERFVCALDEDEQRETMEEAWALVSANWGKIEQLADRCRVEFLTIGSACVDVHPEPAATKSRPGSRKSSRRSMAMRRKRSR